MQRMHLLDVDAATKELSKKSLNQIERETALTWGARAAAAYTNAGRTQGTTREHWLRDAENYRQESLEHAAMTDDMGLLTSLISELKTLRADA